MSESPNPKQILLHKILTRLNTDTLLTCHPNDRRKYRVAIARNTGTILWDLCYKEGYHVDAMLTRQGVAALRRLHAVSEHADIGMRQYDKMLTALTETISVAIDAYSKPTGEQDRLYAQLLNHLINDYPLFVPKNVSLIPGQEHSALDIYRES